MQQDGEVMKSSNFELARDSPETVPSRSPGVGASPLGREGPAPPLSRAAGALGQLCRQTCSGKFRRASGTGGTPGRTRTDHIVQIHGGEPPRAHRRDGSRGTGPRRQRGESCSRPAVTWQLQRRDLPSISMRSRTASRLAASRVRQRVKCQGGHHREQLLSPHSNAPPRSV